MRKDGKTDDGRWIMLNGLIGIGFMSVCMTGVLAFLFLFITGLGLSI
jgi:hypothetical protein